MDFKSWLIKNDSKEFSLDENTVSQFVKSNQEAQNILKTYQLPPDMDNLDDVEKNILRKWIIFQLVSTNETPNWFPHKDVLFVDKSIFKKMNKLEYTVQSLKEDNDKYHRKLAETKKTKWTGHVRHLKPPLTHNGLEWVSLDTESEPEYGESMGHCGNAAGTDGDNIWSLYDPQTDIHYLTFIVKDQVLGESKGRKNSKPQPKFYPNIKQLLTAFDGLSEDELPKEPGLERTMKFIHHALIMCIKGGGYAPENNFQLTDLDPDFTDKLRKIKPHIDDYAQFATRGKALTHEDEGHYYISPKFPDDKLLDLTNSRHLGSLNFFKMADIGGEFVKRNLKLPENLVGEISKSSSGSYYFAAYYFKGKLPPEEIVEGIARDPQYAAEYAAKCLKGKNIPPVLMASIKDHPQSCFKFCRDMDFQNCPKELMAEMLGEPITCCWYLKDRIENDKPFDTKLLNIVAQDSQEAFDVAQSYRAKQLEVPQVLTDAIMKHPRTLKRHWEESGEDLSKYPDEAFDVFMKNWDDWPHALELLVPSQLGSHYRNVRDLPPNVIEKLAAFLSRTSEANHDIALAFIQSKRPLPKATMQVAIHDPHFAAKVGQMYLKWVYTDPIPPEIINSIARNAVLSLRHFEAMPIGWDGKINVPKPILDAIASEPPTARAAIAHYQRAKISLPKQLENPERFANPHLNPNTRSHINQTTQNPSADPA